jgi:hypothetical protein
VSNHSSAARLLLGGVGLLLVFSACSSDNASPAVGSAFSNATTTVAVAPTVGVVDPAATTTVAIAPATPAPVDGPALLQQALAAIAGGYHFNQTATIDGVVAVTVDGDRLVDGTRMAVSNEAGLVNYVITPAGTWLMPENGEWEADDSPAPAVDPIIALYTPTSVSVAGNDGTTVQLVVTVPLASLGVPGEGDGSLQVTVASGVLTGIVYTTTSAEGKVATSTTVIGPVVDPSPVVPPI